MNKMFSSLQNLKNSIESIQFHFKEKPEIYVWLSPLTTAPVSEPEMKVLPTRRRQVPRKIIWQNRKLKIKIMFFEQTKKRKKVWNIQFTIDKKHVNDIYHVYIHCFWNFMNSFILKTVN